MGSSPSTALAQVINVEVPSPPEVVAQLSPIVAEARAFVVNDQESNAVALERFRQLRAGEKAIETHFAKAKKDASDAHKSIVAAVNGLVAPIAEARGIYDRAAQAFEAAEREKARQEEERLRLEAKKREDDRALMDAAQAEAEGDTASAEAIISEAAHAPAPAIYVAPAVAKVEGVSTRTTWSAEVTDLHALVKHVATHPDDLCLLLPNGPALNKMAQARRQALSIPGVRAMASTVRSSR